MSFFSKIAIANNNISRLSCVSTEELRSNFEFKSKYLTRNKFLAMTKIYLQVSEVVAELDIWTLHIVTYSTILRKLL